jgi:hypothetical protein
MKLDPAYEPIKPLPEDNTETTLEWVAKHFEPADVFGYSQLELWAINAGFVREEKVIPQDPDNPTLTKEEFLFWYHGLSTLTLDDYCKSLNK